MPTKTYKESPFGKGRLLSLDAAVGINGGPYNYADYALGYFQAGNLIAEHLIERRDVSAGLYTDIAIYPLLYLYRHATELFIKHCISTNKINRDHNLDSLWKQGKKEVIRLFGNTTVELLNHLKKIDDFVLKIQELDPEGEVARFPEDLSKNRFLQDYHLINIEPIYILANEALGALENIVDELSERGYILA